MRKKYQLYFGTVYISFGNVEPKFTYKLTLIVWNWLKHSNTMDRKVCEMFWKAFELEFIRIKVRTYCPAAFSLFHFCSHSSTLRIFFDLYFVHRLLIICLFIELYSIRERKKIVVGSSFLMSTSVNFRRCAFKMFFRCLPHSRDFR